MKNLICTEYRCVVVAGNDDVFLLFLVVDKLEIGGARHSDQTANSAGVANAHCIVVGTPGKSTLARPHAEHIESLRRMAPFYFLSSTLHTHTTLLQSLQLRNQEICGEFPYFSYVLVRMLHYFFQITTSQKFFHFTIRISILLLNFLKEIYFKLNLLKLIRTIIKV